MKCYKVVRHVDDKLVSAVVPKGIAQLTYTPEKKTTANPLLTEAGYGILTFKTRDAARVFLRDLGMDNRPIEHLQIWRAEGEGKMKLPKTAAVGWDLKIKSIKGFMGKLSLICGFPYQTLMFKSLTLLKKENI